MFMIFESIPRSLTNNSYLLAVRNSKLCKIVKIPTLKLKPNEPLLRAEPNRAKEDVKNVVRCV